MQLINLIICFDVRFLLFSTTYFTVTAEDYDGNRSVGNDLLSIHYRCSKIYVFIKLGYA